MPKLWKYDRAKSAIDARIKDVEKVDVVDYTRDTSLQSIPTNKAYRLDGVHLYVEIVNFEEMLSSTISEGETCHKRALRFLNLHYRAVHRILSDAGAIKVDFHNQRLHAVIAKPYGSDSEAKRVNRAVAIAMLIIDVLAETGDDDDNIPNASVRVGIDSGKALVVNNGRNGNREPLFLGRPANIAAKLASNDDKIGIYLSNEARVAIQLDEVDEPATTELTNDVIRTCEEDAKLGLSVNSIVDAWRKDNDNNPIGTFYFTRSTPPLKDLDITALTPGNSRRMEMVSIYADIDNFTAFVDTHIEDNAEDVVRCLHVIRAELDRVLSSDFSGRRIRFIGDCIHGHLLEGTAHTTDEEATITTSALCCGGLRSSFDLALERLEANGVDTDSLGLAIGFEFGPAAITRLGIQGSRVRCSTGRSVIGSEMEQKNCNGSETAIGQAAYEAGSSSVRKLFGEARRVANLSYDDALEALVAEGDVTAKAAWSTVYEVSSPAIAKAADTVLRPHTKIL